MTCKNKVIPVAIENLKSGGDNYLAANTADDKAYDDLLD